LPLSVSPHAENHHEAMLVLLSFDFYIIEVTPEIFLGGCAYDRDKLNAKTQEERTNMITPLKFNRVTPKIPKVGTLCRYQQRRIVEKIFA
jgi:hypothetical protein